MSNLVDRFVQSQPPQAGAQASPAPVPTLSLALVPYAVVFGGLAWVGSKLAEETWAAFSTPRRNPRRRRHRESEPEDEDLDGE